MKIETMTRQQMFDTALAHMRKQGKLARDDDLNNCYYRHPEDHSLMCAVGCLLTDAPDPTKLDTLADAPRMLEKILDLEMSSDNIAFLQNMQRQLHDDLGYDNFHVKLEEAAQDLALLWDIKYVAP